MNDAVDPGPWSPVRNTVRMALTIPPFLVAHAWRSRYLNRMHVQVDEFSEAPPDQRRRSNEQVRDDGTGPIVMRTYRVDIEHPTIGAEDLMDEFRADPNHFNSNLVAGFVHEDEAVRNLEVGDELVVELPGPWNGPCAVDEISTTSLLLSTLHGHLEAGHIRFRTIESDRADSDGSGFTFEIRSWARAGDRGFALLHLGIPIGKELQTAMWCAMCDRVVAISGGRRHGPIQVVTEELAGPDGDLGQPSRRQGSTRR